MTIKQTLTTTTLLAALCGFVQAQSPEKTNFAFQYFANDDKFTATAMKIETLGGKIISGKPFSGTEERHTLQILGDGTRIDKKESDKYFRDNEGRTRIERDNGETIMISDPVSGGSTEMSTGSKTARKIMVMKRGRVLSASSASGPADVLLADKAKAEARATIVTTDGPVAGFTGFSKEAADINVPVEDLGTQLINGVRAKGSRTTVIIPVGQIGNDREIKIVSERWFSDDLGMLIKSSNKDPRFGETTYELNNILTGAQDPTLFQVPTDFKINHGVR